MERWKQWLETGLTHPPFLAKPSEDTVFVTSGSFTFPPRATIYVDGSAYNGTWVDIARSGWSWVVTTLQDGVLTKVAQGHGHLPGLYQANYRGAVYVLVMALTLVLEQGGSDVDVAIVTDCERVLRVWDRSDPPHYLDAGIDLWTRIRVLTHNIQGKTGPMCPSDG